MRLIIDITGEDDDYKVLPENDREEQRKFIMSTTPLTISSDTAYTIATSLPENDEEYREDTRSDDNHDDDYEDDDDDDDDFYDAASEEITLLPTRRSLSLSPSKSSTSGLSRSSRHTNGSARTPSQKLTDYIQDILEADEDVQDSIQSAKGLPKHLTTFFYLLPSGRAALRPDVLLKINALLRSYTVRTTVNKKRPNTTSLSSDSAEPMSDEGGLIDPEVMLRLLKILYHSVLDQEDIDPFVPSKKKFCPSSSSNVIKNKRMRFSSPTPANGAHISRLSRENEDEEVQERSEVGKEGKINTVVEGLTSLVYHGTAAHCAMNILSSDTVDDSARCEEIMLPYLHTLRIIVQRCILPFVQACVGISTDRNTVLSEVIVALSSSGPTQHRGKKRSKENKTINSKYNAEKYRTSLTKIVEILQSILSQISALGNVSLSSWKISEAGLTVITASILPLLFTSEPEGNSNSENLKAGKTAWSTLAASCGNEKSLLSIIRTPSLNALIGIVEHCNAEQCATITSNILDHVFSAQEITKSSRRQYGLENGKSIHSVTALLVQLIQTFTKPIEITNKIFDELQSTSQQSISSQLSKGPENNNAYDIELLRKQLDEPRNLARQFAEGLLQRVKQKKSVKNVVGNESGVWSTLEWITNDFLELLFLPRWPGASLILSQLCRLFIVSHEDRQSSPELRGIAIDFLGLVATHLQGSQARLRALSSASGLEKGAFSRLNVSIETHDKEPLDTMEEAYTKLISYLRLQNMSNATAISGSARFLESQWAVELALLHRKLSERSEVSQGQEQNDKESADKLLSALDEAIQRCVTTATSAIPPAYIHPSEERNSEPMQELFETVIHTFNYMIPSESIIEFLITASGGPVAINRGKALRAIGTISQADEQLLQTEEMQSAIKRCLLDESVNVRDTAVALLGRLMLGNQNYIEPLLSSVMSKIDDTGLLVRKRTLRLLSDIYHKTSKNNIKTRCAIEIVRCVEDDEQSMQDLAVSIIFSLWFTAEGEKKRKSQAEKDMEGESEVMNADQEILQSKIASLCSVVDRYNTRASPLEVSILRLLDDETTGNQTRTELCRIVDFLATNLAEIYESSNKPDKLQYGKALALLVRICPASVTISLAKSLLPCVRPCSSIVEVSLLGTLLSVYATCLPNLPKLALSFAYQLQDSLRPLISQPSPHLQILPELMQCYGAVIKHHTHDYAILVKTLQQCHRLLCGLVSKARSRKKMAVADRNDAVIIRLTALLVEHVDFDKVRKGGNGIATSIDQVTRRSIKDEIVTLFLRLFDNESFVIHALHGLRFVFRGYPELLTTEEVREKISDIFKKGQLNEKAIILRALADVLVVDEDHQKTKAFQSGYGELVGNSESLANPISFEIVQVYLDLIVLLIYEPEVQGCILEILQHIIMRGMCHPNQCLPCLAALQTQINVPAISLKAQQLHKNLVTKIGSNISFRYAHCAKAVWEMHLKQRAGDLHSVRGSIAHRSILQPWYDIVLDHQQKQARLDILSAFLKSFDIQTSNGSECGDYEVQRARFMAEALSVLEFKTVEEVQFVIDTIQDFINLSGEQVRIFAMEEIEVDGEDEREEDDLDEGELNNVIAFGQMSTILSFAFLLRIHLMEQFGISEQRSQSTVNLGNRSASKPANRKTAPVVISWHDIPAVNHSSKLTYKMAKQQLIHFDNLFSV